MRRLVALVVMVVAPVALSAAPVSASAHHRHLHESDSGRTIHVERGDEISVRLPGGSGGYHRPHGSDRTVVHRVWSFGGYPDDADARARFVARHRGTADLTSYTDYACLHTTPRCLPPQKMWVVHVVVE